MKDKNKGKFGKIVKGLLKGVGRVADNALLGGAITNMTHDIEGAPKGKFDWSRFVRIVLSSTVPIVLLILLAKGVITFDQLKELLDLI